MVATFENVFEKVFENEMAFRDVVVIEEHGIE